MTIGEAAKTLGVSAKMLKALELRGLIKRQRTWFGWRVYADKDLNQVRRYIARKAKRYQRRNVTTGQFRLPTRGFSVPSWVRYHWLPLDNIGSYPRFLHF